MSNVESTFTRRFSALDSVSSIAFINSRCLTLCSMKFLSSLLHSALSFFIFSLSFRGMRIVSVEVDDILFTL